jgi:hypothetical protein
LPVSETLTIVRSAEVSAIPARNTGALRYGVQPDLWQCGLVLDSWVESAFGSARTWLHSLHVVNESDIESTLKSRRHEIFDIGVPRACPI